jgi:hypothetical protein
MKRPRLKALVIFVMAHVLCVDFEGFFGFFSCFLDQHQGEHGEQENDADDDPGAMGLQVLLSIGIH